MEGIELSERTIIVQPKVRKVLYSMFQEKQSVGSLTMPKKPETLLLGHNKNCEKEDEKFDSI